MDVSSAAGALGKVADGGWEAVGASDILGAGQRLIAGMRSTTGQGRPDSGETFAQGATRFLDAVQTLHWAHPRDHWEGVGAGSYIGATRRVAGAAEALAVLDRGVHTVIDREATQIVRRREALDDQAHHLSSLRRVTGSLAAIPGVGPAMTSSIELAAVTAAVSVCSTELRDLATETADNASRLRRIAGDYEALVDESADAAAPTDEAEPTEPVTEPSPTDEAAAPDDLPAPTAGMPAPVPSPVPSPPMCPATTPASAAAEQSPMQGDMMSGLTSAFGAVGGMIGTAVAPLAAALSGVVSAAGQLPSLASQAAAPQTPQVDVLTDTKDEDDPADSTENADDRPAAAATDLADSAGAAPPETPAPPERAPSPPPSPPAPAATRPPQ